MEVDWKKVEKDLAGVVEGEFLTLFEGATHDIQTYAVEIAASLAKRMAAGEDSVSAELKGQLKMLAEVYRLKVSDASWSVVNQILNVAMGVAKTLLGAALGGLPGAVAGAIGGN